MEYGEILNDFLHNYGCSVVCINSNKSIKGILAPVRDLSVEHNNIYFNDLGFTPKPEWVLISEVDDEIIKIDNTVLIDNKLMKIINCDNYILADKPFYKRAYLYQIKEIFND